MMLQAAGVIWHPPRSQFWSFAQKVVSRLAAALCDTVSRPGTPPPTIKIVRSGTFYMSFLSPSIEGLALGSFSSSILALRRTRARNPKHALAPDKSPQGRSLRGAKNDANSPSLTPRALRLGLLQLRTTWHPPISKFPGRISEKTPTQSTAGVFSAGSAQPRRNIRSTLLPSLFYCLPQDGAGQRRAEEGAGRGAKTGRVGTRAHACSGT